VLCSTDSGLCYGQIEYKKSPAVIEVLGLRIKLSKLEAWCKDDIFTYQHIHQQRVDHFHKVRPGTELWPPPTWRGTHMHPYPSVEKRDFGGRRPLLP
jgi:hypothetical protein